MDEKGRERGRTGDKGMCVKGKVLKYGDDVNTDVIFPGRYLHIYEPEEMAKYAMEDLDPEFRNRFERGDIIVGGRNFGCGSSREQAVTCLKYAGVGAIIARSFSRIYYRNCINQGIPILVCRDVDSISDGDILEIDAVTGEITDHTTGAALRVAPLPEFIQAIIRDGGLVPHLKKKLAAKNE